MNGDQSQLDGMVPAHLRVRSTRILLEELEVDADIGFHEFEVGKPQRLLITVEIWLNDQRPPAGDDPANAWDYDLLRGEIRAFAASGRFNLQETLAHALYNRFAALAGVKALRVVTAKPDIYADARGVGIAISSFE